MATSVLPSMTDRRAPTSVLSFDGRGRLGHAPGIEGLRGVAVAAVVVYHLRPDWLPGGFLGVEMFFVLSGFLITSLLLSEVAASGRVRVWHFLLRRARRLLPAMFAVVAATCVLTGLLSPDIERARARRHAISTLTYSMNWRLVRERLSYTDLVAGQSPFRHMWSLAIEEQFYIGVAVLLGMTALLGVQLRRIRRGHLAIASALLALGSVCAMWVYAADPAQSNARAYYATDRACIRPADRRGIGRADREPPHRAGANVDVASRLVRGMGRAGRRHVAAGRAVEQHVPRRHPGRVAGDRGSDRGTAGPDAGPAGARDAGAAAARPHVVQRVPVALAGHRVRHQSAHALVPAGIGRASRRHHPGGVGGLDDADRAAVSAQHALVGPAVRSRPPPRARGRAVGRNRCDAPAATRSGRGVGATCYSDRALRPGTAANRWSGGCSARTGHHRAGGGPCSGGGRADDGRGHRGRFGGAHPGGRAGGRVPRLRAVESLDQLVRRPATARAEPGPPGLLVPAGRRGPRHDRRILDQRVAGRVLWRLAG